MRGNGCLCQIYFLNPIKSGTYERKCSTPYIVENSLLTTIATRVTLFPLMPLQLVKPPAQRSFAEQITKLELFCTITGLTLDDCVLAALNDYVDVVVAARLSQFEILTD